jgi:energy-coupling factor transporter transmembrane protein EcfT
MRIVTAGFSVLRPFSRGWIFLCLVALFLTLGFGGGTPNSALWLIIKFSLLGLLLGSLLVVLASRWESARTAPRIS